jgi:hypothetical protein
MFEDYRENFRLIPYGNQIYGLYNTEGYQTYSDDYSLNTTFEGDRQDFGLPLAIVKFNKEVYNKDCDEWNHYWEWKKNRNKNRAEMEDKFGFDGKHACHLVRLLRMGVEALRDGVILVKRPDASELLSIRNGAWTYDEIVEYAEQMDHEVREVWYKKTNLRKTPDLHLAAQVLMEVQDIVWQNNTNSDKR